jgi:dihydroorotase
VGLSDQVGWDDLITKVTDNPRKLLGLEVPVIEEDAQASLTLFHPGEEWVLNEKTNRSKSKNSPWFGTQLKGKVKGVVRHSRHWFDG